MLTLSKKHTAIINRVKVLGYVVRITLRTLLTTHVNTKRKIHASKRDCCYETRPDAVKMCFQPRADAFHIKIASERG